MPLGFEEKFKYGKPMYANVTSTTVTQNQSLTPLLEYDAVYSYRSGKRSNSMQTTGSYESSVRAGRDLVSSLIARKKYLEDFIRDSFEPQVGNSSVFSTTDTGHPFATFKVRSQQPYARLFYKGSGISGFWDVNLCNVAAPYPDLTNPFGTGIRTDSATNVLGKQTYFVWPAPLLAAGKNAPSTQQTASLALKNQLGAGLIANTNPYAAKADMAVTIGELLTGNLPRILARIGDRLTRIAIDWKLETGRELGKHTNPGNEWLSYHFGWVPLVNDIISAVETLYKLHLLVYGASDESRRHRGGDLGTVFRTASAFSSSDKTFGQGSPLNPLLATPFVQNKVGTTTVSPSAPSDAQASWLKQVRVTADYRFSARFHSGTRANGTEIGYLDRALELLGADITPATLWNLAPWTWLLDWFSNMGTVVQNLSDLDWSNVLLDYAYLTLQVKTVVSRSIIMPTTYGTMRTSHNTIAEVVTTTERVREQASPVGFSVSWNGLSPFQLSILAALGMTRGR